MFLGAGGIGIDRSKKVLNLFLRFDPVGGAFRGARMRAPRLNLTLRLPLHLNFPDLLRMDPQINGTHGCNNTVTVFMFPFCEKTKYPVDNPEWSIVWHGN